MSPKQKQRTQIESSTLEENENYFVAKLTRPLSQNAQSGPLLCKNQLEEGSSSLNQPRLMSIPRFQQRFLDQTVNLRLLRFPTNNHSVIVKKNKAIWFRLK